MTGHQLLSTSTQAGKCGGTKRDKALYAQHDAGLKDSWRRLLNITHRDKTAYAQHDQPAHWSLQSTALDKTVYAQHGRGLQR